MFCEECGKQIADGDKFCDQCGWKVPEAEAPAVEEAPVVEEAPAVEETPAAEEAPAVEEAPVAEEAPAVEEAPVVEETPVVNATPVAAPIEAPVAPVVAEAPKAEKPKKEKKGSGKAAFLVIATVVIVIGLLIAFNYKALANFAHKTFDSPEKYYAYIEGQQVEEIVDTYMLYYDEYFVNTLFAMNDKSVEANISVEFSEDLRDLMSMSGVDFDWLEAANIGMNMSMTEDGMSMGIKGGANKVDLASMNILMDFADEMMYMQVPELNKTYMGADFGDADISIDEDMWEQYDALKQYIPESKELRKLLVKYANIALGAVEDVDKSTEKVKVGDITQNSTALEVTFDSDTVQAMLEAVLEEMLEDKDLEKLFVKVMGMAEEVDYPVDPDDMYDQFIETVEEALDNIEDFDMGDFEMVMIVYVDGEGNVIGREVEAEGMKVTYLMPEKGSKFEMEYAIEMEEYGEIIDISLEGAGKKKGNKISGEFEVKYEGISFADIVVDGYDIEKAKKGESVGSFTISASKSLKKLTDSSLSSSDAALAATIMEYSLQIDMDTDLKGGTVSFTVLDGEDVFAKLTVEAKTGKGTKLSVPSDKDVLDPNDEDDMEEWVEGVDWDKFIKTLEKAEIPDDYIEELEDLIDELD